MKNYLIYSICVLCILLTVPFGCSEDFLKVDPTGRVLTEDFLQNEEEITMAIVGVYDIIQRNYSSNTWNSAYFMKNLPADDCNAGGGGESDQSEYQYLDDFQIKSDNSKIRQMWYWHYKTISSANKIIEAVDPDTDAKAEMVGEAKALRAFAYFELVTIFGDVPLITSTPVESSQYHNARTAASEVYAQIETDLGDAIGVLPLKSEYSAADKFRVSKGAAQAMLGKALLFQEKYGDAVTVFSNMIGSTEYDLEADYSTLWDESTEFGVESVFETSYTSQEGYDWGTFSWDNGEANIEIQLQGTRDFFDLGNTGMVNGWGFNYPTKKLWDAFIDAGDSVRRKATVMSEEELIAAGGAVTEEGDIWDYEGYIRVKYACRESQTDPSAIRELNYTTNWRLIRYADVLLMAAEAYNKSGTSDEIARGYVNQVRGRVGLSPVSTSGDALFEDIVKERQLELAMESVRYQDLVRWGEASAELGSLGFESNKHELFPIPMNEIIGNNAISEGDQNPGY